MRRPYRGWEYDAAGYPAAIPHDLEFYPISVVEKRSLSLPGPELERCACRLLALQRGVPRRNHPGSVAQQRQKIVGARAAGTTFNPALRAPGRMTDRRAKPIPVHP